MAIQDKKQFLNGITSDIAPELIPEGTDIYRLNVRVLSSGNGQYGVIETLDGTTWVESESTSYALPSGNNISQGFKQDEVTGFCYAFIFNYDTDPLVSGKNSIIRYNPSTGEILPVFIDDVDITGLPTGSVLNFQQGYFITGIVVQHLDSQNTLLGFTDGYVDTENINVYNEPRKINVEKGIAFVQGDYTNGYQFPFEKLWVNLIRKPPSASTYEWNNTNENDWIYATGIAPDVPVEATDISPLATTFPFNTAPIDQIPPEFDTSTYEWTAVDTDNYNIYVKISLLTIGTDVGDTFEIDLKSDTGGGYTTIDSVSPPYDAMGDFTLALTDYSVTAGDKFKVVIGAAIFTVNGAALFGSPHNSFVIKKTSEDQMPINNLYHQLPQFKTRWIYKDSDKSVFSSMTDYMMPYTNTPAGTGEDYQVQSDRITIGVPTGSSEVAKIEIAVKMVTDTNFSSVVVLDKAELNIGNDTYYEYVFLNNTNLTPLTVQESESLFDRVFIHCNAMEAIQGVKWLLGSGTEGWNQVDIDIRPILDYEELEERNNPFFPARSYLKSGQSYDTGIIYMDDSGRRVSTTFITKGAFDVLNPDTGKYGTTLNVPFLTEESFAPTVTDADDRIKQVPKPSFEIYHTPPSWAKYFQIVRSKGQAILNWIQFSADSAAFYDQDHNEPPLPNSTGAAWLVLNIGNITGRYKTENPLSTLVYEWTKGDRLRLIASPDGVNSLDYFFAFNDSEIQNSYTLGGAQYIQIRVDANTPHTVAPIGVLYEIYTPAKSVTVDNELTYEVVTEGGITIDQNGSLVHSSQTPSYNTQQIEDMLSSTNGTPEIILVTVGAGIAFTFIVGKPIKIIGTTYSVYGTLTDIPDSATLEVTINPDELIGTYNELGGTVIAACVIEMNGGDCFKRLTDMPRVDLAFGVTRLYTYTECMSASNMFTSNAYDYGRPNRVDFNARQLDHIARIRYSENLIEDTQINGLSTFYDQSYQDYNPAYGKILRLWNRVEGLTAYQQLKMLLIPVEQNVLVDTGGGNLVTTATKTINQQSNTKYYAGEYGIGNQPESWSFYGNVGYNVDVPRSAILRISQDGLTNLSQLYGQQTFWTQVCQKIMAAGGEIPVYGAYDVKNSEYVVSVPEFLYRDAQGEFQFFAGTTIAFNEKKNAFSTHYNYEKAEFLGRANDGIVGFYQGKLYTMGTNATQNLIFGEQKQSEIWYVINKFPSDVKILEAISQEVDSDDNWVVYSITTPHGQETRMIYNSNWVKKENVYYGAVKRNINTPNVLNPIVNGDPMRDRIFIVKMKYTKTTKSKLFAVNSYFIKSERSNK